MDNRGEATRDLDWRDGGRVERFPVSHADARYEVGFDSGDPVRERGFAESSPRKGFREVQSVKGVSRSPVRERGFAELSCDWSIQTPGYRGRVFTRLATSAQMGIKETFGWGGRCSLFEYLN